MIVHRLGRTILLDEFDVHSHLLRLEKVLNYSPSSENHFCVLE
jgi:hypothetical protein